MRGVNKTSPENGIKIHEKSIAWSVNIWTPMVLQNCNKATFINSLTEITLLLIYLDFWGL